MVHRGELGGIEGVGHGRRIIARAPPPPCAEARGAGRRCVLGHTRGHDACRSRPPPPARPRRRSLAHRRSARLSAHARAPADVDLRPGSSHRAAPAAGQHRALDAADRRRPARARDGGLGSWRATSSSKDIAASGSLRQPRPGGRTACTPKAPARARALVLVPLHRAGSRSPVGRTRTAPPRAAEPMQFAIASCQRWDHGHYAAWRHMRRRELDLVLFLGDYIYEVGASPRARAPARGQRRPAHAGAVPQPLCAYKTTRRCSGCMRARRGSRCGTTTGRERLRQRPRPRRSSATSSCGGRPPARPLGHAVPERGGRGNRTCTHLQALTGAPGAHPRGGRPPVPRPSGLPAVQPRRLLDRDPAACPALLDPRRTLLGARRSWLAEAGAASTAGTCSPADADGALLSATRRCAGCRPSRRPVLDRRLGRLPGSRARLLQAVVERKAITWSSSAATCTPTRRRPEARLRRRQGAGRRDRVLRHVDHQRGAAQARSTTLGFNPAHPLRALGRSAATSGFALDAKTLQAQLRGARRTMCSPDRRSAPRRASRSNPAGRARCRA